jgi:hypothetical protein
VISFFENVRVAGYIAQNFPELLAEFQENVVERDLRLWQYFIATSASFLETARLWCVGLWLGWKLQKSLRPEKMIHVVEQQSSLRLFDSVI